MNFGVKKYLLVVFVVLHGCKNEPINDHLNILTPTKTNEANRSESYDNDKRPLTSEIKLCKLWVKKNKENIQCDDSIKAGYFDYLFKSQQERNGTIEYADSLHDFTLHLIDKIQTLNLESVKMCYYLHFIKCEKIADGSILEFISDYYYSLFFNDPCEFFQVLYLREISEQNDKMGIQKEALMNEFEFRPQKLTDLYLSHLELFKDAKMKGVVTKYYLSFSL